LPAPLKKGKLSCMLPHQRKATSKKLLKKLSQTAFIKQYFTWISKSKSSFNKD